MNSAVSTASSQCFFFVLCKTLCLISVFFCTSQRLAEATIRLTKAQEDLKQAQAKLKEVEERVEDLKRQYDEKLKKKEDLRMEAEMLELKLDRAGKLVTGLAGERVRWEASAEVSED